MSGKLRAVRVTATGTVFAGKAAVAAVQVTGSTSVDVVTLRSGGASGEIVAVFDVPVGTSLIPTESRRASGLEFDVDIHATLGTNVDSVVVLFREV